MPERDGEESRVLRQQQHAASLLISPPMDARRTGDAPPASHCWFVWEKKLRSSSMPRWSLDKISSSPRHPFISRFHCLCSLHSFSGKHHFISKWCQNSTHKHVVRTPGMLPADPAVHTISSYGPSSRCPLLSSSTDSLVFPLWFHWISFSLSLSRAHFSVFIGNQLNYADDDDENSVLQGICFYFETLAKLFNSRRFCIIRKKILMITDA